MATPRARAPRKAAPRLPPVPVEAGAHAAGRWEIVINDWVPTPLNRLLKLHWAEAGKLKAHDRRLIALYSHFAGVPDAECKRRVSLRITLPKGKRRHDPDSHWKSLLDGCVKAKLLKNDSQVWLEMGSIEYDRGERLSTTIILEEI